MTSGAWSRRSIVGVVIAATAVAASMRTPATARQQAGVNSPAGESRIEEVLKQVEGLLARGANKDVLALLQPLARSQPILDPALDASVHWGLARAYDNESRYAEAIDHFQRAADEFGAAGNRRAQARSLRAIAQVHKNTGGYERGIAYGQQALSMYTEIGDGREIALTHIVLGAIHDSVGDHRRALESFERALPFFEAQKNHDHVNLLNEIGISQKNLGNYTEARRTYLQGLELAREIKDTNGATFLALNLAVLDLTIGETERAVEHGQEALRLAREAGSKRGETIVLENLASAYWELGNHTRAVETMQSVLGVARQMGTRNQEGIILKDLGDMYAVLGNSDVARARYSEALAIQRDMGERKSIASTLIGLSDLSRRAGQLDEATRFSQESVNIARESERPELEWTARRALAQAAAASGRTAQAIDELRASTRIINDLRANVADDLGKVAFVDRRQEVFGELAALLVRSGRPDEALEAAEAGRARAFADLLKQRQVLGKTADREALETVRRAADDYRRAVSAPAVSESTRAAAGLRGGDVLLASVSALASTHRELASLLTAESPTMADIRGAVGRLGATLVEYLVTDRQTLVWVVEADGVTHSAVIDVTREQLEAVVAAVQQGFEVSLRAGAGRHPAPRQPLLDLHRWLIAPIEGWLPASANAPVVVVPHGPLALVPFAALEDRGGHPLIERHVLSFAPSASVFAYTGAKGHASGSGTRSALVVADPTPPSGSGLEALPWARLEGRQVARRLGPGRVRLLVGDEASEAVVKREAGAYSTLHFATHGLIATERPLASSLTLGSGAGEDGYLRVDEIFNLDLAADLVVLSGCSTGLGKLTGDGVIGLTRAFIYAGTPTVVVSQWSVSDKATSILMDRFYTEIGRGRSAARALRAAALGLRAQYPDPAFWAAFQVVGEP